MLVIVMSTLTVIGGAAGVIAAIEEGENVLGFIRNIAIGILLFIGVFVAFILVLFVIVSFWTWLFAVFGMK